MSMKRVWLVVVGVALLIGAALIAIEKIPMPEHVRSRLREILLIGAGLAITAAFAAVAVLNAPWYVAAAAAGTVLVSTGAYAIAADVLGLPQVKVPGGGSGGGTGPNPCEVGPYIDADGVLRVCVPVE